MADRKGLGLIGYLLGSATVLVMLIGMIVVGASMAGNSADAGAPSWAVGSSDR